MDELDWIDRIRTKFVAADPRIVLGIGDDAAVLATLRGPLVVSVDASVEGVHFERAWLRPDEIGHRAYVAALSDLAAMASRPVAGLLAIVAPPDSDEALLDGILEGVAAAAREHDAPIVGGNLSSGGEISLTTTVLGEAGARTLTRGGAQVGDAIYVTGTLGEAALGWRVLADGGARDEDEARAVARWRRPRARFDLVAELARIAGAAIDVSDGLAQDLSHVLRASGVGARVEAARLPIAEWLHAAAPGRGHDATMLALSGGEDYELLFTAPLGSVSADLATRIGEVVHGGELTVHDADGRVIAPPAGHRHLKG